MKKAALYVRVSTAEQAEGGYSLAAQEETLRRYCDLYELDVYRLYADAGLSGKEMTRRVALNELMQDASKGLFQVVLVWKISRMSRSLRDLLNLADQLDRQGIALISCSENFDSGVPVGRMTMQLLGSIAEFERNTIVENVRLGIREVQREGKRSGGAVLGYDIKDRSMTVNALEADCVRWLFERYASGTVTLTELAREANAKGYSTKRKRPFTAEAIGYILANPVYCGINRSQCGDTVGAHEPIVSTSLFKAVHLIRRQRKTPTERNRRRGRFPLSGRLICPLCGQFLYGNYSRHYRYYRCNCGYGGIRADRVEEAVKTYKIESDDRLMPDIRKEKVCIQRGSGVPGPPLITYSLSSPPKRSLK